MSSLTINVQKTSVEEKTQPKKLGSKISTLASFWEKTKTTSNNVKSGETSNERKEELEKLRKTESISTSINAFKTLERSNSKIQKVSSPTTEKEKSLENKLLSFAKTLGIGKKEEEQGSVQNENVILEKTNAVKVAKEQFEVKLKTLPKKQPINQWKDLLEDNPPLPIIEALNGAIKYNDIPAQELLKTYREKSESFIGQHEHFLTMTNPFYHFERDVPNPPPKNLFKKHDFSKWEKDMENKLIKFI